MHTPQTLGGTCFPSDCSQLGASLSPSLSPSSGPAGDSTDTCGPAYAHPGASPDRHVRAGEVSQAVGTEGMLGRDPWDPRQRQGSRGSHLVCFWGWKAPTLSAAVRDSGVETYASFLCKLAGAQCHQVAHG